MNVPAECLASRRGAAQVPPDCARHIAAAPLSWLRLRECALFCLVAARSKPELAYERGYGGAVGRPGLGDQPAPERLYGDRTPVRADEDENRNHGCFWRVEPSFYLATAPPRVQPTLATAVNVFSALCTI